VRSARLSLAILLTIPLIAAPAQPVDEYQVKALFLYNFAKFVEWPPEVLHDPSDPLVVCVLGQDPFGRMLDDAVAGKKVDGRSFVVRRIAAAREANVCRILFVGSSQSKRDVAVIATIEPGVLTVGESNNATSEGMVINFTLEGANVRFKISTDAADRQKLRLSSKLLSLATTSKR
jgi:YfiR/HmsC-like